MITRDTIETAYSFFHQKRNVYIHSSLDWQRDDIEYAIASYVDDMCRELYDSISGGASDFQNNTEAYVSSVARTAGVNPDALLPSPRKGRAVWVKIVAGMHLVENGMMPVVSRIEEGWELAFAKI